MTREDAINNLNMISVAFVEPVTKEQRELIDDTINMAIKALEQEPICIAKVEFDEDKLQEIVKEQVARIEITTKQEPCDDVISRQAVINLIRGCNSALEEPRIFDCHNAGVKFEQYVTGLPSVKPQEPILDKIKTEIERLTITEGGEDYTRKMAELYSLKIKVLQIIDKYRGES